MIETIIFDMDGVPVDNELKDLGQLRGFYKNYGTEVGDAFMHSLVGSSYMYAYTESMRAMHMDWLMEKFKERPDDYCKPYASGYDEVLSPGIKETLTWLWEHGYKTAAASSLVMHQTQTTENVRDLVGCFDGLLSSEVFHESKPNPEIYLTTVKKLKMKSEERIAVEDSSYGIAAGNAAGMRVFAYADDRYGVNQSKAYTRIHHAQEIKKYLNDQENRWSV